MMMPVLVDQFAIWLQSRGQGTVGQTIFKLQRPSTPVICLSIHATGGYRPERYGRREHPTLQVVARAATPNGALAKAYAVMKLTHNAPETDLGAGMWANSIQAMSSPAYIGEEAPGAHLASLNLVFDLKELSN